MVQENRNWHFRQVTHFPWSCHMCCKMMLPSPSLRFVSNYHVLIMHLSDNARYMKLINQHRISRDSLDVFNLQSQVRFIDSNIVTVKTFTLQWVSYFWIIHPISTKYPGIYLTRNESHVKDFQFWYFYTASCQLKMPRFDANPIQIGYLVKEL